MYKTTHLYGRRLKGKYLVSSALRVPVEVDENVDPVRVYKPGNIAILHAASITTKKKESVPRSDRFNQSSLYRP